MPGLQATTTQSSIAGLWCRKVDPATGGYIVEGGRYVRIPAALGAAHALIATDGGSVPAAPQFSCRVREVAASAYLGMTRAVENTIGDALARFDGVLWRKHTVKAWLNELGRLEYEATVDGETV